MRKQVIETAAFEVAAQVRTVEEAIETALGEIATLQSRMVHARAATGIGVVTSHAAFELLASTLQSLVAARGGIGNCHAALAAAKSKVPGLRTVAWGDGEECPPPEGSNYLRVVA